MAHSDTPADTPADTPKTAAEVSEAAAYWTVHLAGDPSDAQLEAFAAWIAQSPEHLQAFNDAEDMLSLISHHSAGPELLAMRSEALERVRRTQKQRWLGGVNLSRRQMAAAVTGLIAIPAAATWWMTRPPAEEILTTGIGEQRTVTLSDGSRVTMDAKSQVRVAYSRDLRLLELVAGRAYFAVAKDASRPLRVRAGERAVTALGTAFSVERESSGILVTLVEGRVAVSDPRANTPIEMKPHQELRLSDRDTPVLNDGIDTSRALAWRDGQVVFDNVDLDSAVARMNTYSRTPILIEEAASRNAPKLGSLRISGVFTAGDSLSFAEAIKAYFDVTVTRSDTAITLRTSHVPTAETKS